jgi:hypothetical protein
MLLRVHREQYVARLRSVNEWGVNEWRTRRHIPLWCMPEDSLKL